MKLPGMLQKCIFIRMISFIFIICIFAMGAIFLTAAFSPAGAQSRSLVITGNGLHEDIVINQSDWLNFNNSKFKVRYFSSNNNFDFHKIWKVKGYDLLDLFGTGNLKSGDHKVSFIAADGLVYTETISSLRSRRYYPEFSGSGQQVNPMIGFYRDALFEPDYQGFPTEVNWEDRALTSADLDDRAPRLYIGQKQGNPSDKNQQYFVRGLARIVVGEERPEEEPPAQKDPDGQEPDGTDTPSEPKSESDSFTSTDKDTQSSTSTSMDKEPNTSTSISTDKKIKSNISNNTMQDTTPETSARPDITLTPDTSTGPENRSESNFSTITDEEAESEASTHWDEEVESDTFTSSFEDLEFNTSVGSEEETAVDTLRDPSGSSYIAIVTIAGLVLAGIGVFYYKKKLHT